MDVPTTQGSEDVTTGLGAAGTNSLKLEECLKVVRLVKGIFKPDQETRALVEALIRERPESAQHLCTLWGVPYAYGALVKALVDRDMMAVLHLAYSAGLL